MALSDAERLVEVFEVNPSLLAPAWLIALCEERPGEFLLPEFLSEEELKPNCGLWMRRVMLLTVARLAAGVMSPVLREGRSLGELGSAAAADARVTPSLVSTG